MPNINTTLNLRVDGELYPLNTLIKQVEPALSQPSAVDLLTTNSGKGFYTGDYLKIIHRKQFETSASSARGDVADFIGATTPELHKVFIQKLSRADHIIINEADIFKLQEGKGPALLGTYAANFILDGKEEDLKLLYAEAYTQALTNRLHISFDTNGLPATTQPAQGNGTEEQAKAVIEQGRRVVPLLDPDETAYTRMDVIRRAISYLNTLGTERNVESNYLFSINGLPLSSIVVTMPYLDNTSLKDRETNRFINVMNMPNANMTGIVSYIDNAVRIIITNQIPSNTHFVIHSDRAFVRDLDPQQQYIGKVRDVSTVKMRNGEVRNIAPNERDISYLQARTYAPVFSEEMFFITKTLV